ncbi:hypothetical protein ACJX0J_035380, partial [Zea mays]
GYLFHFYQKKLKSLAVRIVFSTKETKHGLSSTAPRNFRARRLFLNDGHERWSHFDPSTSSAPVL